MKRFFFFIFPYAKRQKKVFLTMLLFIIISALAQTLIPVQIKLILDEASISSIPASSLIVGFFAILGLSIIDLAAGVLSRGANNRFSQRIQYDIRQSIFVKLQKQEIDFYSNESIGQIMSRTIEEVFILRDILGWGMRILLLVFILYIMAFIVILQSSWLLAITYITIVPIIIGVLAFISTKKSDIFYQTRFKYGELNEVMAENYVGIKTVKSFGREQYQIENFDKVNKEFYDTSLKEVGVRSVLQPGVVLLINLGLLLLIFFAGSLVQLSVLTAGDYVAFMLLTINIATPGRFIGYFAVFLQIGNASARRLKEVIDSTITVVEDPVPKNFPKDNIELQFKNVSFTYPSSTIKALEDVNITISAGEKIALLGQTGSGKSTLINLLPRLYDPTHGQILIGGVNIRKLKLKELRKSVGIVHQDNFLFTRTIAENIRFGRNTATMEEVIEAAKAAQLHDFIDSLPNKYETIIGERGETLSGGQKQRLAIARELVTNPDILVFDDSVSAVDPETESNLQRLLMSFGQTKTLIIISQRPASLKFVDRIIVLDEGKIVQSGNHQELLKQEGVYRKFNNAIQEQIKFIEWGVAETKGSVSS